MVHVRLHNCGQCGDAIWNGCSTGNLVQWEWWSDRSRHYESTRLSYSPRPSTFKKIILYIFQMIHLGILLVLAAASVREAAPHNVPRPPGVYWDGWRWRDDRVLDTRLCLQICGRGWFWEARKICCSCCHHIDNTGGNVHLTRSIHQIDPCWYILIII